MTKQQALEVFNIHKINVISCRMYRGTPKVKISMIYFLKILDIPEIINEDILIEFQPTI